MDFETKIYLLKHAGLEDDLAQMGPEYEQEASMMGPAMLGGAGLGLAGATGARLGGMLPLQGKAHLLAQILGGAALPAGLMGMGEWATRDNRGGATMNRDLSDIQSDIDTGLGMQDMDPMQLQQLAGRSDEISQYLAQHGGQ